MFSVELTGAAAEFYRKSDKPLAKKIARCFQQLEQEPRQHGNVKPLRGNLSGQYRYRVGDHRVIYYYSAELEFGKASIDVSPLSMVAWSEPSQPKFTPSAVELYNR